MWSSLDGGEGMNATRLLVVLVMSLLVVRCWHLFIRDGSALSMALRNQVERPVRTVPKRGEIRDRDGRLLAGSRLMVDIRLPEGEILEGYQNKDGWSLDIDLSLISQLLVAFPEAQLREREGRFYPLDRLFSHVVGYTRPIDAGGFEDWDSEGYGLHDRVGAVGIEAAYETVLKGKEGETVRWVTPGGGERILDVVPPQDGAEVRLTLSAPLQWVAWEGLEDPSSGEVTKGVVILADPTTGEILAMVSRPAFSPLAFMGSRWEERAGGEGTGDELLHRATMGLYPPASTFKIVSATMAMERMGIDPYKTWDCKGWVQVGNHLFKGWRYDYGGHGHLDLLDSIAQSCDETFYYIAKIMAVDQRRPEYLSETARLYGFGAPVGIPLSEKKGTVPDGAWKRENRGEPWYGGDSVNMIIGQGFLEVTPIQLLAAYQPLAHSVRIIPRLVLSVGGQEMEAIVRPMPMEERTREILREGLLLVVQDDFGTAKRLRQIEGVEMSGKTGTAQVGGDRPNHGWFVGYGEIRVTEKSLRPIMILVFAEHGGSSSSSAVPIAGRVLAGVRDSWRDREGKR